MARSMHRAFHLGDVRGRLLSPATCLRLNARSSAMPDRAVFCTCVASEKGRCAPDLGSADERGVAGFADVVGLFFEGGGVGLPSESR
jgi:hypothetical protein